MYGVMNAGDVDDIVTGIMKDPKYKAETERTDPENLRACIVQLRFEFQVAYTFASLVNQLGFPLPGYGNLQRPNDNPFEFDVARGMHAIFGLAQHHGIPTRLIDWTYNPLVAAFFAAEQAREADAGCIAVWALDQRRLKPQNCKVFTVPYSQIGFLHAQQGLFTYLLGPEFTYLETGEWPRMEDVLPHGALRKVLLPKGEASQVMRLLWAEQISKAHLMPTLDNVTQALRHSWRLATADIRRQEQRS